MKQMKSNWMKMGKVAIYHTSLKQSYLNYYISWYTAEQLCKQIFIQYHPHLRAYRQKFLKLQIPSKVEIC